MRTNKFKISFQHDAMQCGIACLQMVCRYFGREYSAEALSHLCFAITEGVSMLGISQAAETLGLHTVSCRMTLEELCRASLPCILHWNENHFVVLYKVRKGRFYVADPGKGLPEYSRDEFAGHWARTCSAGENKGIVMLFQPTDRFGQYMADVNTTEKRSLRFLFGYIRRYRQYLWQILLGLLLGCLLQLAIPFLTQAIVDVGIKHRDIHLIWLILAGELTIVTARTATDFIRRWLLMYISMRINISLVSDFFIKLLQLPMAFFDTKLTGDLMQRMQDHKRVEEFLTNRTLNVMFSILGFIVFGVVLLTYSHTVFLIFLFGSMAYGLWITAFLNRRKVLDHELFDVQARNQNKTWQFITSMQEIKLQDCEHRRRWEWEDIQAEQFSVYMKTVKLQQSQEAGSIFINELKNIIITVVAATSVINGEITLGMMLAIQYITGQLNSPVEQLMGFVYSLQDVRISLERINEIHLTNNEEDSGRRISEFTTDNGISLRNICFKYNPHALRQTISGISICIPSGKITAIVGSSGSGKTTLIKLMLGYYPVSSGMIDICGSDIRDINLKWWRRHCGVVMQDGVIFSESIARNIAVGDGEVDTGRLEHAARIANIHDYIMKLPLKYNTQVGKDGVGLSQGQKQRILIARAVYKNPDFIFLDEATNALDANNERAIVENLNRFYRGRTVVIVAHRLSTVQNADQIVVIDGGRVVETGNHELLTKKRGAYYDLVRNQLELGN